MVKHKGRVVLLGNFNDRVGRSTDVGDAIGIFDEDTGNASGNKLISFLNKVELVINPRRTSQRGLWYLVCKYVCVSVCVSVCLYIFTHYTEQGNEIAIPTGFLL